MTASACAWPQGEVVDVNTRDWKLELEETRRDLWIESWTIYICHWVAAASVVQDAETVLWRSKCPPSASLPIEADRFQRFVWMSFRLVLTGDPHDPTKLWLIHTHLKDGHESDRLRLPCVGKLEKVFPDFNLLSFSDRRALYSAPRLQSTIYPFSSQLCDTTAILSDLFSLHYGPYFLTYFLMPPNFTSYLVTSMRSSMAAYQLQVFFIQCTNFPIELIGLLSQYITLEHKQVNFETAMRFEDDEYPHMALQQLTIPCTTASIHRCPYHFDNLGKLTRPNLTLSSPPPPRFNDSKTRTLVPLAASRTTKKKGESFSVK